ncbi:uncharacterized protein BJ171DRAFT_70510 [Polychytrium aggregatum]|uniref:uncharacterized protein n=1 Tax=Polychytrium aggregatum TaxID=110093 RepID=UPI0022FDCA63|nr:uncharacterized protein BJ171DRAFT_70510 [Polychytrium aggregatum]KAI9205262.1 hypothetical protein BJ171DRAFT_70510 [Polychytrium aggregatum]
MTAESPFPIETIHTSREIRGVPTQACVMYFADKIWVVVTQFNKVGNLVLATQSTLANPLLAPPSGSSISTKVLLGQRDDPRLSIYASSILARITTRSPLETRPLLLGIALHPDPDDSAPSQVFEEVMDLLESINLF